MQQQRKSGHRWRYGLIVGGLLAVAVGVGAETLSDIERLHKQGQSELALQKLEPVISQNTKALQPRFLKGLILADLNRTNEAITVFRALTDEFPEVAEPYNNLAVLYVAQKQYEKARIALEMAIRTHPTYAMAHANLADVYAKLATLSYDKALKIEGNSQSATNNKLTLLRQLTNNPQAVRPPQLASSIAVERASRVIEPPPTPSAQPALPPSVAARPTSVRAAVDLPDKTPAVSGDKNRKSGDKNADKGSKSASGKAGDKAGADPAKRDSEVSAQRDVIRAVQSWAQAWSSKNLTAYFGHYAPQFAPSGSSRAAWQVSRRERINKPGAISVSIASPKVTIDKQKAVVRFVQSYRSGALSSQSSKTLELSQSGGRWLIVKESGR